MSRLGDILSDLRVDRGLTQQEVSKMLNISNSSLSAFETGSRAPNNESLVDLARFYDVSADYLLGLSAYKASLSTLNEVYIEGVPLGMLIQNLMVLSPKQRVAISQIIADMCFSAEVTGSANRMR